MKPPMHFLKTCGAVFLAALAFAGAGFARPPEPAPTAPALWVVRDADSTLYLFGTIHLLRPGTPLGARVDAARATAEEVWTEIDMSPESVAAAGAAMIAAGFEAERPLSSYLTEQDAARLNAVLAANGLPAERFAAMRPWLAGLLLGLAPAMRDGFDAGAGADAQVGAAAQRAGQRMRYLETAGEQVSLLSGLSEATQVALLLDAITQAEGGASFMDALSGAWSQGAEAALNDHVVLQMRAQSPELYAALIVRRNTAWMETIEGEMAGAGVDFVAVGAAHVIGPDGLVAMLRARGYTVTRVSTTDAPQPGAWAPLPPTK